MRAAPLVFFLLIFVQVASVPVLAQAPPNRLDGPPPQATPPSDANATASTNTTSTNTTSPGATNTTNGTSTPPATNTTNGTSPPPANTTPPATLPPTNNTPPATTGPPPETVGSGTKAVDGFAADVCLKSFRSRLRPYECAWDSRQRIYNRFWVTMHASKPFTYRIYVEDAVVAEGSGTWYAEWNSSTTLQVINVRVQLFDAEKNATGGNTLVQYEFLNMGVRGMSEGEEDEGEGEGGTPIEEMVPKSLVALGIWRAVAGATLATVGAMFYAYAWWEERTKRMHAELVLGS